MESQRMIANGRFRREGEIRSGANDVPRGVVDADGEHATGPVKGHGSKVVIGIIEGGETGAGGVDYELPADAVGHAAAGDLEERRRQRAVVPQQLRRVDVP